MSYLLRQVVVVVVVVSRLHSRVVARVKTRSGGFLTSADDYNYYNRSRRIMADFCASQRQHSVGGPRRRHRRRAGAADADSDELIAGKRASERASERKKERKNVRRRRVATCSNQSWLSRCAQVDDFKLARSTTKNSTSYLRLAARCCWSYATKKTGRSQQY